MCSDFSPAYFFHSSSFYVHYSLVLSFILDLQNGSKIRTYFVCLYTIILYCCLFLFRICVPMRTRSKCKRLGEFLTLKRVLFLPLTLLVFSRLMFNLLLYFVVPKHRWVFSPFSNKILRFFPAPKNNFIKIIILQ